LGPAMPVPGSPSGQFVRSGGGFILLLSADGKPKKTTGQVFSAEPGKCVRMAC
jgi:hypothetical protein